ncbi:MAG: hypothetical protein UZ21_OP11001000068 [Microgenomates bacterium OLB22]|nr:MAG: hypothetical protein UZ21_OP11001000068 [Microgenomates bacterium OLB22]
MSTNGSGKTLIFPIDQGGKHSGDYEYGEYTIQFGGEALEELERIRKLGGHLELYDVIASALGYYMQSLDHVADGGRVLLEDQPISRSILGIKISSIGRIREVLFPYVRRRE